MYMFQLESGSGVRIGGHARMGAKPHGGTFLLRKLPTVL